MGSSVIYISIDITALSLLCRESVYGDPRERKEKARREEKRREGGRE
jgi:hypothetical protein